MTGYEKSDLMEYLEQNLKDIRKELGDDELLTYPPLLLGPPSQIEVFWMSSPVEMQMIAKTRDENRKDGEIIINGPSPGEDFVEMVDHTLNKPRWQQAINVDEALTRPTNPVKVKKRRDVMISPLRRFIAHTQNTIFRTWPTHELGGSLVTDTLWVSFYQGNIIDSEHGLAGPLALHSQDEDGLTEEEDKHGSRLEQAEAESEGDTPERGTESIGGYIYEPVWVENVPEWSFEEYIFDRSKEFSKQTESDFQEHSLAIHQDGFIDLIGTSDKSEAVQIFNSIFAVGMLFGYEWEAIQEGELGAAHGHPPYLESPPLIATPSSPRETLQTVRNIGKFEDRPTIKKKTLDDIVRNAALIHDDNILQGISHFILQAYTHYRNQEHSQAFLLNWILLEQLISHNLEDNLKEKLELNSDRRNRITDSPHWFASHRIELAEIIGIINRSQYSNLDSLRKKRNKIVHEMEPASEEDSEEMMNVASDLVAEVMPFSCDPKL